MSRKKKHNGYALANVKITRKGDNPDCVHYEIIQMQDNGIEVGVCQHCNQERTYTPLGPREKRPYGISINT